MKERTPMKPRYRFLTVSNNEEAQKRLNEMAEEGYVFLSMTSTGGTYGTGIPSQVRTDIHIVMEYMDYDQDAEGRRAQVREQLRDPSTN
jgi:hypothetical protein